MNLVDLDDVKHQVLQHGKHPTCLKYNIVEKIISIILFLLIVSLYINAFIHEQMNHSSLLIYHLIIPAVKIFDSFINMLH